MNCNHLPVLVVGTGPVGLVAALTLLQNGISVRIIEKNLNIHIGQRASGIQPRTLELYNFLDVPEVNNLGTPFPLVRSYKRETMEPLELQRMLPFTEPTPAIPFFVPKLLGQDLHKMILRRHLEKYSCFVETGTELRSFEQSDKEVTAVLAKKQGEDEILETLTTNWMIGADGAKGVVRKHLGLTFQGETRDDFCFITGDIRLICAGLDRMFLSIGNGLGVSMTGPSHYVQLTRLAKMADSSERLPVISDMLEVTTSILNTAVTTGSIGGWNNRILFMLGIHYRFSDIVLDEFASPVEGKPIDAYRVLDETYLEAGGRAPDAPKLIHVYPGKSDVMILFTLYRSWCHTVLVFTPSPADATPILAALEWCDKSIMQSAVILPSSTPATPFASAANFVLVDQEGHAYSAYLVEASQTKVFVVWPDGVIGAIVRDAEGVRKYFSRIFREM
ncbi:hypothetical protein AZE42_12196 [Rhizopogon vesiculosus]|uniref:FAD-binding domain-containing protein n=1 Tax=Rhizopogon vesiculosus TaxID=180088 RepID=A0A1J8QUH3_9AGAM|nr:hypothetical protein AZE42_12196 [Rhizopogon vesiculosus]